MKPIPDHFINAICTTLLYSLWLGLLLAAVTGAIVMCTRRSTAALRYNLLLAGLGIFTAAVLFIFFRQLFAAETILSSPVAQPAALALPASTIIQFNIIDQGFIAALLRTHGNSIVLIWLLIVLARAIQLMTGLQSLYVLRRRNISIINGEWQEKVKMLAAQSGIQRMVMIAESGIAKVPMVIGHVKPLIVVPLGLINALPAASVEAILLHELAHIHRRDYLVNLLVSSLEIIFFFNPAVLWLAALIRTERENCCDDFALAHSTSKTDYIKALVACQEYQLTAPAYAMGFSGNKDHLLRRVKRMIYNSNPSLNITERAVLAIGLLTAVLITAAFSTAGKINQLVTQVVHVAAPTPKSPEQIKPEVSTAGAKTQPAIAKVSRRKTTVKETGHQTAVSKLQIYRTEQAGNHTGVSIPNGSGQTTLFKQDGNLYPLNRSADQLSPLAANSKTSPATDHLRYHDKINALPKSTDDPQQQDYYPGNAYPIPYNAYHDGTNREKLTAALIADGIIQNSEDLLSFKLSDTSFIVNGKKLPDETYQKFRDAFVKAPAYGKKGSWSWLYNYNEQTMTSTAAMN